MNGAHCEPLKIIFSKMWVYGKSCKDIQANYNLVEIWQMIRMFRIM